MRALGKMCGVLVAGALLLPPAVADAGGALSKVVGGMKQKVRASGGGGSSGGSPSGGETGEPNRPSGPGAHPHRAGTDGDGYWRDPHRTHSPIFIGAAPYPTASTETDVYLYAGLQSVEDSDGAGFIAVRASHDDLGISLKEGRFWEHIRTPMGRDVLTLDLWSAALTYRAASAGDSAVWLEGGVAGANSDDLGLLGGSAGLEMAHNVNASLGLEASARLLLMQHGVRGVEARGGLAASFLRLGYRATKLNTGPALRGFEFGVAFRF